MGAGITLAIHDNGVWSDAQVDERLLDRWSSDTHAFGGALTLHAHGTLCALLAAGAECGAAPKAKIVLAPYAVSNVPQMCASLDWASVQANVVLCPWIMTRPPAAIRDTMERLTHTSNTLFVCPVGNRDRVAFPASLPGTLGVGAYTSEGELAPYSAHGRGLDVLAPSSGGKLPLPRVRLSADLVSTQSRRMRRAPRADSIGGTSAAAAIAAGIAATVWSVRPNLSATAIHRALCDSCDPMNEHRDNGAWNHKAGWGMLNADAAVDLLLDAEAVGSASYGDEIN